MLRFLTNFHSSLPTAQSQTRLPGLHPTSHRNGNRSRSVRCGQPLHEIIPTVDSIILLPCLFPRVRQSFNISVEVRVAEICNAVSRRVCFALISRLGRWLNNPMLRRLDFVVTPPTQQIARIDDNCILDLRLTHESAFWFFDLEPADIFLEEQGDAAVIGMLTCANPPWII